MKDFLTILAIITFIVAAFYAFWVVVLIVAAAMLYYALPLIKALTRRESWK
jgi:hypothetical protein